MVKPKPLKRIGYICGLLIASLVLCGPITARDYDGSVWWCPDHWCWFCVDKAQDCDTTLGNIGMTGILDTDLAGYPAAVFRVDSQLIEIISMGVDLVYDTAFPAPAGTLKAVNPGTDLFPAVQEVYLNWLMISAIDTFRATSTVTLISDELDGWPMCPMNYSTHPSIDTVWFKNINDPTDSLSLDLSNAGASVCYQQVVPALTNWGLIVLLALLILAGIIVIRQRRKAVRA